MIIGLRQSDRICGLTLYTFMKHIWFSTSGLTAEAEFFRSSCFFGSGNNIQTRTRRGVSSILTWSSKIPSFLVLEIFFFQNKKKTCFQLPKPYTSYAHFVHSLKQGSIRWSKKHISSGKKVKQCIPLNVRSWSRNSLSFHEFRATPRVLRDLRWLEHPGTFFAKWTRLRGNRQSSFTFILYI